MISTTITHPHQLFSVAASSASATAAAAAKAVDHAARALGLVGSGLVAAGQVAAAVTALAFRVVCTTALTASYGASVVLHPLAAAVERVLRPDSVVPESGPGVLKHPSAEGPGVHSRVTSSRHPPLLHASPASYATTLPTSNPRC